MGRPKSTKSAPEPAGAGPGSREFEGEEAGPEGEAPGPESAARGGISKVGAVRRALADGHGSPAEGTAYIRQHFGINMAPTQFSTTKSQIKKKGGGTQPAPKGGAPSAPGRRKPLVEGYVAPPPKPPGEPDVLLALESVKELVERYGAEQVKRMVNLLG